MSPSLSDLKALPVYAPLLAAVIAPISTLLDIPALTETWFFQEDRDTGSVTKLPDPHANIALSGVGLGFNVIANVLLILRFSVNDGWWEVSTFVSLICWVLKFGIALGNILAYGILTRNTPGIAYGEGFWCAVMSLLLAGLIVALLFVHYVQYVRGRQGNARTENQRRVRVAGRHFMLENTLFVLTIGLLALFMSEVEGWSYLQGIYFSIVSILTVGFGDFYPTKTSTQIVLFPAVLIGIVQLASIIELLVRFFRGRLAERNAERRRAFERRRREEKDDIEDEPNLERELEFLRRLYRDANNWQMRRDLIYNGSRFLLFWLLGALIFSQIEGWTYGQGLYFCYVFFYTIGFGDYAPITAAGRVVFIVYSIIAVPVMASFAVQTVQNIVQKFAADMLHRREAKAGIGGVEAEAKVSKKIAAEDDKELPQDVQERLRSNVGRPSHRRTHTDILKIEHERIELRLSEYANGNGREKTDVDVSPIGEADVVAHRDEEREREEDRVLTEYVLELAVELEKHARRLLLGSMEEGNRARMLLKADRIVQLRSIKALAERERPDESNSDEVEGSTSARERSTSRSSQRVGQESKVNAMMLKYYEEETELLPFPNDLSEQEMLEEITRYREAFAGLLAAGSRLLRLKDQEKFLFERRFWREKKLGSLSS